MNETNLEQQKWICEYCTYANYPSALKCTMCRGPKPYTSEYIYKLHGGEDKHQNVISTGLAAASLQENKSIGNKWRCELCTFLNTLRDQTCVQCGSPVTANNLHDYIQPLRISQNSDVAQSLSGSRNTSPPASITNMENSRRNNAQAKWSCPTCTYENWPKSTKCAMCGYTPNNSTRSQASGLILPSPECDVGIDSAQEERLVNLRACAIETKNKWSQEHGILAFFKAPALSTSQFLLQV